ncbi:MAG TPA: hypothetical protein VGC64_09780 [Pyrinomonadaceae bacterium]
MSKQEEPTLHAPQGEMRDTGNDTTRTGEQDDVAEPDAPTSVVENSGMNTVLDGDLGTGVQEDENER